MEKHHQLATRFRALADPTRAAMVARLAAGPATVSDLAAPHALTMPTILKHLRALQDGGIVVSVKEGRTRLCRLNPAALTETRDWLTEQAALWEARLDRLDALALTLGETDDGHP